MTLKLPKLISTLPIVDPKTGQPTSAFLSYMQRRDEALEAADRGQQELIDGLAQAVSDIQAARRHDARTSSYTRPTNVLTATLTGTTAKITVMPHVRVYPGLGERQIAGGEVLNRALGTDYAVFYDDPDLDGTGFTFDATTDFAGAAVGAAPARHTVGVVTTPAAGGGTTTGGGGTPPGGGGRYVIEQQQ